jgi:outer membrane protein OmpA-like peptidoglycan-associated protein
MKKCLAIIGVTALSVFTAVAADVPKAGVFLGYEYVRFNSATDVPAFSANGGSGQFTYNFNHWLSGVADLGAVHNGNISGTNLDSTFASYLFGPRVSIRKGRITPYFQVLWGGVYSTSSTQINGLVSQPLLFSPNPPGLIPGQPITARVTASETAFAMTAGGGIDIKISRHVSFRPIGLDYYLTRMQNLRTAGDNNQNNIRYTAGVNFLIGGEKPTPVAAAPAPPRTKTCPDGSTVNVDATCPKLNLNLAVNAASTEICQGDSTQVIAAPNGAAPNQLTYTWSVNGQAVSHGPTFEFGSAGRAPGTYRVELAANGGGFNPASTSTTITVREYVPPTGTAAANPAQIRAGEASSLSASFQGQCGGNIQAPTFEASEGTVNGTQFDSTGVVFDSTNNAEQRKTVTITAKAADNRNVGTATTTIEVIKAAVVAPIRLPDVLFSDKSARVNNCGKRILLEQLRSYVQRDASGTVYLVGHTSSDEPVKLAEQRALNAAAVITAGSGICLSVPQSQVQVSAPGADQLGVGFEAGFCQASVGGGSTAADSRRVEVWFVPTGGQAPPSVVNSQSATALPLSSLGCPK